MELKPGWLRGQLEGIHECERCKGIGFYQDRDLGDETPQAEQASPKGLDAQGVFGKCVQTLSITTDRLAMTNTMLERAGNTLLELRKQRDSAIEALEVAEWGGVATPHYSCPGCGESREAGHTQQCRIGNVLGRSGPQVCAVGSGC